jgi:hypothetical protein
MTARVRRGSFSRNCPASQPYRYAPPMAFNPDDIVEIDGTGIARAGGAAASLRMQASAGRFQMWPGPPQVLVMRRIADASHSDVRSCPLMGEIHSPGSLCDIVSFVAHTGRKGELVVVEAEARRSIFFDQGHVVGAQSTAIKERLGEVLYRYGMLSREQVELCSEETANGALRFGEAAVRKGFISRETLFRLMGRQTEDIFYGMVSVGAGVFYLLESYDDAQLSARHQLSVAMLIREGVRRMHETRFFRARIPSERHVPQRTEGRLPPESDPIGVFAATDGLCSVADLCRVLGRGEFEITRALFQLIQTGHIVMRPPRLDPDAIVAVYNRAISLLLCELDAMDEGDTVRAQLATFAEQGEVYATLFAGAGPADDGTLQASRVSENMVAALNASEADERLAAWLYEYASYALFLARPHLRRMEQAREGGKARLSKRVTELLEPIAPAAGHRAGDVQKRK